MYKCTKIITNDGVMFDTEKEAKKHIEVKYTDMCCRVASKLCNLSKYQEVKKFLDDNIETFRELTELKDELSATLTIEE